ncbi:MAG: [FeFe] hydrogenase, group A [Erysipelotrichaceae bacterium]
MSKHLATSIRVPVNLDNPALKRIESLCIKCGKCRDVCEQEISIGNHFDLAKTFDTAICVHCGQCINVCPTGALVEIKSYAKVKEAILDKNKKVVVMTSPSVRAALGEEFGMDPGSYVEEEMVGALRSLGVDYVFDTTFAADLTIMEEASELIDRITNNRPLPQFTSCCPAWVKFAETYYPSLLPNLSTSKSPIAMFGPTIKTYFAQKEKIAPQDIICVALTPCTAKKFEINREEMNDSGKYHHDDAIRDVDYVITTRELGEWLKSENKDFNNIIPSSFDSLMPRGSGAGIIFGNSGGVMEAALRTAHYLLTNTNPSQHFLNFEEIRGLAGIKIAETTIAGIPLKVAVIQGLDYIRHFLDNYNISEFHFIEVMTCRGGCIGGGGQPKHIGENLDDIRKQRISSLYQKDSEVKIRNSHDNVELKNLYQEFYKAPLSSLSEDLLHTHYQDRSATLGEDANKYASMYQKEDQEKNEAKNDIRYKCSICGYIYEGDITLEPDDFKCPICFVGKELFEKI